MLGFLLLELELLCRPSAKIVGLSYEANVRSVDHFLELGFVIATSFGLWRGTSGLLWGNSKASGVVRLFTFTPHPGLFQERQRIVVLSANGILRN